MKKERGITLIALIITVILIIIIAGITMYSGRRLLKESDLQTVIANMLLIQAKAETIKDKVQFTDETALYGTIVVTPDEQEEAAGVTANEWYKWDSNTFEQTGLSGIDSEDVYYVNYHMNDTADIEVIYKNGYKHTDNNKYYNLSEIKELSMDEE